MCKYKNYTDTKSLTQLTPNVQNRVLSLGYKVVVGTRQEQWSRPLGHEYVCVCVLKKSSACNKTNTLAKYEKHMLKVDYNYAVRC